MFELLTLLPNKCPKARFDSFIRRAAGCDEVPAPISKSVDDAVEILL